MNQHAPIFLGVASITTTRLPPQVLELSGRNGFDGELFEKRTISSVNGFSSVSVPDTIAESFDRAGGYVVPLIGEAHDHDLSDRDRVGQQGGTPFFCPL